MKETFYMAFTKKQIFLSSLFILGILILSKGLHAYLVNQTILVKTQIEANTPFVNTSAGIEIEAPKNLGETEIKVEKKTTEIEGKKSINRIVEIQSEAGENLDATLVFHYKNRELNDLDEEQLILYSSEDDGATWNPHMDTKRDLASNKLFLENVQHASLWTAAAPSFSPMIETFDIHK